MEASDNRMTKKARTIPQARSKLACDQCRKRKLKCDEPRPCKACRTRGQSCIISSLSKGPGRPRNHDVHIPADGVSASNAHDNSSLPANTAPWNPEQLDTALSTASAVSQTQRQTHAEGHNIPLSDFEASFPSSTGLNLDHVDMTNWNEGEVDIMEGIWELPSLVRLFQRVYWLRPSYRSNRR